MVNHCGLKRRFIIGLRATQPALDRTALNVELSIYVKQGQLTADMNQLNGSVLFSNPLDLAAALQNSTTHYGMLVGRGDTWTLVFGAEPQETAEQVFVNGHRAEQKPMTAGYRVWDCFLPGDVSHPLVTLKNKRVRFILRETGGVGCRAYAKFLLRKDLRLYMFRQSSGRFVGSTGLHRINWDVGLFEISYWIRTAESHQGLVTEAVHGIVRWAADHLDARRIEIRCDARNLRSRNVAERAGFHLEAVLRQDEPDVQGLPERRIATVCASAKSPHGSRRAERDVARRLTTRS